MKHLVRTLAFLVCCTAAASMADSFPQRPLRIIVGFTAGTAADIVARQIALKLAPSLGKQVVVENREGGAGTIATAMAARATADGHTMFITSPSIVIGPFLIKDVPYDVFRDFAPVSMLAIFPAVLVVAAQSRAGGVRELLELARANPGRLNYATAGKGTASHLSAELMRSMSGVNLVEVAYRSSSQALNDTISGEVAMYFPNLAAGLPNIRAGRLKALAVTRAKRSPAAPDIAAMAEILPGYAAASWYGISVPAGTPPAVIARLHDEIVAVLRLPEVRERLLALGGDIVAGSARDLQRVMREGADKWGPLVSAISTQNP